MELKLNAEIREKNEKLAPTQLAAVLYGRGQESVSLKLNYNEFDKLFAEAGESNLISLNLKGEEFPILVKDLQRDVLKHNYIHVDLYKVNMKEKVKAEIPLEFVGEAKAIKELGGIFITNIGELSVECLPGDLVDHIEVDISSLEALGDVIRIEDITVPKGIQIMQESHEIICVAEEPKKVEEKVVTENVETEEKKEEAKAEEKAEENK